MGRWASVAGKARQPPRQHPTYTAPLTASLTWDVVLEVCGDLVHNPLLLHTGQAGRWVGSRRGPTAAECAATERTNNHSESTQTLQAG